MNDSHTYSVADGEWVARVSGVTGAYWIVIDHLALGVQAASGWTGIAALLIDACLSGWALGARDALGTTSWWATDVRGRA